MVLFTHPYLNVQPKVFVTMSLKISLARGGAKKNPYYRLVVTNSRSPRDSKIIEKVGTYNPLLAKDNEKRVIVNADRIKHWLSVGAQPTEPVARHLRTLGLYAAKPTFVVKAKGTGLKKKAAEAAAKAAEAAKAPAPAAEAPAEAAPAA